MRRNLRFYAFIVFLLTSRFAFAQDVCSGILSYTGRDEISESRDNSVAAEIHNQHCEGSTSRRSSTTSIGLEAVVKAIPIKFNFGGTSDEDKLNNFCKVYSSKRAEFSSEKIDRSTVVREALSAFNRCIELSVKGIYFNPKFGRTSFVVDVRRGSDDASIAGVTYDSALLTCRLPPTSSAGATVANKDSVRVLDGNYLPITCERTPITRPSGERNYPRAEVTIATSRGSLLLPVSEDSLMPEQWASQIQDRVKVVSDELDRLRKPRQMECKTKTALSGRGRFSQIAASMTTEEKQAGYKVTGGGCQQIDPNQNFAFIQTRPNGDDGWLCQNGDIPGGPGEVQIQAFLVYCRLPSP